MSLFNKCFCGLLIICALWFVYEHHQQKKRNIMKIQNVETVIQVFDLSVEHDFVMTYQNLKTHEVVIYRTRYCPGYSSKRNVVVGAAYKVKLTYITFKNDKGAIETKLETNACELMSQFPTPELTA